MLLKIQTFSAKSHHPTAVARSRYLLKDGRALGGVSTHNLIQDGAASFREIDQTRERSSVRGSVTGRELVLSPSPDDKITPEQMRAFAHEFLREQFPDAEAAVVIHDDNLTRQKMGDPGIVHAHVYLGVVDLSTVKKIVLHKDKVRQMHDCAQDMSRDRGLSEQPRYGGSERERKQSHKRAHFTRGEFEARERARAGKGAAYDKTFIRDGIIKAMKDMQGNDALKLKDALAARGIIVEKASGGDYKYRRNDGKRYFKGSTLGREFRLENLRSTLSQTRQRSQDHRRERPQERSHDRGSRR